MSRNRQRGAIVGLVAVLVLTSARPASATDWPQFGFDPRHSGNNVAETAINRDNVIYLVVDYHVPLPTASLSDAAPVYASAIATPSGTKDLLFLYATDSFVDGLSSISSLVAIDAATGTVVWVQTTTGSGAHASSSPAVDPNRQYVYAAGLDGYVHKYHIEDGTEVITPGPVGWPELVTLKPEVEKIASGLTIAQTGDSTYLIAVTNGYNGDGGDYQGHVTSIDLTTGIQHVFNAMCSLVTTHLDYGTCADVRSGIWGRGGATFDVDTMRIFVTTGNGHFDPSGGGYLWGDSVLALAPDATSVVGGYPLDSFTPQEFQELDDLDEDLGSNSFAILPAPAGSAIGHLGLQIGKNGTGYLIDLDDMSGMGMAGQVGGELQRIGVPASFDVTFQPAVWVDPDDGSTWLFAAGTAWQVEIDGSGAPSLAKRWATSTLGGLSPVIADGILFAGENGTTQALDPRTGEVLWSNGGATGSMHWQSPIVVDGAIYLTDDDGYLTRFVPRSHVVTPAVNDPNGGSIDPAAPQVVADGGYVEFIITAFPHHVVEYAFGCGIQQDGDIWLTGQIFEDCTVTAYFGIDPADRIFEDGFESGADQRGTA